MLYNYTNNEMAYLETLSSMEQKGVQYACTKCMQWFDFDDLSADVQMCKVCTDTLASTSSKTSVTVKKEKVSKSTRPENCRYCQTYIKVKVPGEKRICERCFKNRKEYGEPKICMFCTLNSAFIGSKCQRCASSKKKYGMPVNCQKCNLKAAFDHKKAHIDGLLLCWKCYVSMQRYQKREKRKGEENPGENDEENETKKSRLSKPETSGKETAPPSDDENERTWRELLGEDHCLKSGKKSENLKLKSHNEKKHELRKQAQINSRNLNKHHSSSSLDDRIQKMEKRGTPPVSVSSPRRNEEKPGSNTSTPRQGVTAEIRSNSGTPNTPTPSSHKPYDRLRNGAMDLSTALPQMNDNIVLVTKLHEEINSLKKNIAKKDQVMLEKDKQISMLKVEHLRLERSLQTKLKTQEEEFFRKMEAMGIKNQELIKKVAQLSKKKS
uniref:protein FAM76B n=1 Tax=Ciona intestinalis TaxID=7719 RepID=UPI00006A36D6|nr:protein FAM76B [Ciona intestinalis]|eukprot:XP_002129389.1 protein FAM76B [Ciona intestinalis]